MKNAQAVRSCLAGVVGIGMAVLLLGRLPEETRIPQEESSRRPTSVSDLLRWVHSVSEEFTRTPLTVGDCVDRLDRLSEGVRRLEPTRFSRPEIERDAEAAIRGLFNTRMVLFEQYRGLFSKKEVPEACAMRLRRAFRHLRGVEDYIGTIGVEAKKKSFIDPPNRVDPRHVEAARDQTRLRTLKPLPKIVFPSPGRFMPPSYVPASTLLNPFLSEEPGVRSGDILLSRGNAGVSALIARMGEEDTQFSHMALVYVDPRTKKAWTIEAHIEFGSIVTPLEEWLADGKSRTMIFRYPNARDAARAAGHMFRRVEPAYRAGKPVRYDFPFNMHDHTDLFCSEVVREGYEWATEGRVLFPKFPSNITMKNRDLMDRLGITQTASFIPADIEVDPRVQIVGEWRNFEKMPDVWQKDAILTSIYTWLERDGYRFESNAGLEAKGMLARALRKVGLLKKKLPTYMTQDMIVLNFVIDTMVEEFQERIASVDAARRAKTGFPMSYYDVLEELERMRRAEGAAAEGPFRFLHPK